MTAGTQTGGRKGDQVDRLEGFLPLGQDPPCPLEVSDVCRSGFPEKEWSSVCGQTPPVHSYVFRDKFEKGEPLQGVYCSRPFVLPLGRCSVLQGTLLLFRILPSSRCCNHVPSWAVLSSSQRFIILGGRRAPKRCIGGSGTSAADPLQYQSYAYIEATCLQGLSQKVSKGRAPKRCIGGSGTSAALATDTSVSSAIHVNAWRGQATDVWLWALESIGSFLVPLCRSLLGLLGLTLWSLIHGQLPARHSPLGKLIGLPARGIDARNTMLGIGTGSNGPILDKISPARRTGNKCCIAHTRIRHGSRGSPAARFLLGLFGLLSLPCSVWGMPSEVVDALRHFDAGVDRLPEAIPRNHRPERGFPSRGAVEWPLPFQVGSGFSVDLRGQQAVLLPLGRNQVEGETEGRWIGVLIYAAYYQPSAWAIRLSPEDGLTELVEKVRAQCAETHDIGLDVFIPVVPQKHPGYAIFINYSSALDSFPHDGGKTVLLDVTRVGGHMFATMIPATMPYEAFEGLVRPQTHSGAEPFDLFVGASTTPWPEGRT